MYLQECEDPLLLPAIHISLFKQIEVWRETIAWSDMPGTERERERGVGGGFISGHASEHLKARPAALRLLHAEQIQSVCARWNPRQIPRMHQRPQTESQLTAT